MADFFLEPFGQVFVQRALVEIILIGLLCGVVSTYVVLRGVAFLASSLAHAVFPGIVIGFLLGGNLFWGALIAGLVVIVGISLVENNERVSENSAIGAFQRNMLGNLSKGSHG